MKHLLCLFFSAALLLTIPLCAQAQVSIAGQVRSSEGKPLGAVSISLNRAKDDRLLKLAITDDSGHFELEIPLGDTAVLNVSSVGFAPYRSDTLILKESIALPLIVLQPADSKQMSGVVVTTRLPFIEKKIDRIVVNVDALIANAGTNALQVLENTPGVRVDNDGTIALRGKSGVVVFIDDKPTYMSGAELAAYLKAMPSGLLDKIEIMTNPPAKYDAAGDAGIINIRTKKIRRTGFNGSINLAYGQGQYGRTNNGLNFNYRRNNVNLFGYLGYSRTTTLFDLTIDRKYLAQNGGVLSSFSETIADKRATNNYAAKLGMDIQPTAKTTVGILLNGFIRPSDKKVNSLSRVYDAAQQPDSFVVADNSQRDKFRNGSINLNYRHRFDSTGREFSVDGDYVRYRSNSNQYFLNNVYQPGNILTGSDNLTGLLPLDVNIYSAKADYSHPMRDGGKIDAGFKSSYVKTGNVADYFTTVNGRDEIDYDKTNDFRYSENINAVYVSANRSFGRLEAQAGLRLENTIASGHQLGNALKNDSSFNRNFTNLFPTAYLSYKLDSAGDHTLGLTYGRRINRPYYQDLNPFIFPLDKFTYRYGNPFLQPQFTDDIELSYGYRSNLNFALVYIITSNMMGETVQNDGNLFVTQANNIGRTTLFGTTIDINVNPAKWWSLNVYSEVLRNTINGSVGASVIDTSAFSSYFSINNQFRIGKTWSAEIGGIYLSKNISGQLLVSGTGYLNAGVRKRILQNKGTLALSARDIFRTKVNKAQIKNIPLVVAGFRNMLDTQVVTFSFTFNFGAGSSKRREEGGSGNEQERVKTN